MGVISPLLSSKQRYATLQTQLAASQACKQVPACRGRGAGGHGYARGQVPAHGPREARGCLWVKGSQTGGCSFALMPPCFEKQGCDSPGARGGEPPRSSRSPSKRSERRLCSKACKVTAGGETHREDRRKPRGHGEAAGARGPGEAARAPRCFC